MIAVGYNTVVFECFTKQARMSNCCYQKIKPGFRCQITEDRVTQINFNEAFK